MMEPSEIKAACEEAVAESIYNSDGEAHPDLVVNAVLDTILAHTGSPYTVDELVRIRGA